jgi:hypothetical protein
LRFRGSQSGLAIRLEIRGVKLSSKISRENFFCRRPVKIAP